MPSHVGKLTTLSLGKTTTTVEGGGERHTRSLDWRRISKCTEEWAYHTLEKRNIFQTVFAQEHLEAVLAISAEAEQRRSEELLRRIHRVEEASTRGVTIDNNLAV